MLNVEKGEKSARVVALQILLNRDPRFAPGSSPMEALAQRRRPRSIPSVRR